MPIFLGNARRQQHEPPIIEPGTEKSSISEPPRWRISRRRYRMMASRGVTIISIGAAASLGRA